MIPVAWCRGGLAVANLYGNRHRAVRIRCNAEGVRNHSQPAIDGFCRPKRVTACVGQLVEICDVELAIARVNLVWTVPGDHFLLASIFFRCMSLLLPAFSRSAQSTAFSGQF